MSGSAPSRPAAAARAPAPLWRRAGRTLSVFGMVTLALGAALYLGGRWNAGRRVEIEAEVVEMRHFGGGGETGAAREKTVPVLRYQDPDGAIVRFQAADTWRTRRLRVGDRARVALKTGANESAEVVDFWSEWGGALGFFAAGAILLCGGAWMRRRAARREREAGRLLTGGGAAGP